MSKNFVVMMTGYTASGKSTTARTISKGLGAKIYHSAIIRKELGFNFSEEDAKNNFFDLTSQKRVEMDKKVYGKMLKKLELSLSKNENVVLDAGHFFQWQRDNISQLLNKFNCELFIVQTVCPEKEIILRLKNRKNYFSKSALNETPSIKAYFSSKEVMVNPKVDEKSKDKTFIICFDTLSGEITMENNPKNENLSKIIGVLNETNKIHRS